MILTVVVHLHSLKWAVPTAIMLGSSPVFISAWAAIRSLTLCLPGRFYVYFDSRLYSLYQRLVLFFFKTYTGVQIKMYGDTSALHKSPENVIFICNHQCTVDWLVANMVACPQGSIGHIRYILKDGLRFFPLYGFYFRQHSCVFVKKSGKFNQQKAEKQLAQLKDNHIPVWLVIFPEGTRMNPELPSVIETSKQYAKEQGLETLEHVLVPKLKGLQLAVEQLQGHVQAVYDLTIAYSDTVDKTTGDRIPAPGMLEFLSGGHPELHLHLERIPLTDVPREETQMKMWLCSRFQQKDRLLSHFYSDDSTKAGQFPGKCETLSIPARSTLPAFLFFTTCLMGLATPEGRAAYWRVGVFGTLAGCLWMTIRS